MKINNRFAILLAEKRMRDHRNISLSEVAKETGISRQAISKWESNNVSRFNGSTIGAICRYFQVGPGDLFERADNTQSRL